MTKFEIATNLANFLQQEKGSVLAEYRGNMPAKQQRELFGQFLGKGTIVINGQTETLKHYVKVCFGTDYNVTFEKRWNEL